MSRIDVRGIRGDVRAAVIQLMGEGWAVERWTGSCHLLLRHTSGATITASSSASDQNAARVVLRAARRAIALASERASTPARACGS